MSAMADLDIRLSELGLSDAQKNALIEVHEAAGDNSKITARTNTLRSLERRDLIREIGGTWATAPDGREALGLDEYDGIDDEELSEDFKAIMENLNTNMWDEVPTSDGVEYFQNHWLPWEKELAGFGETLKWKHTGVWDGLTAEEIRADIDKAMAFNRKDRREFERTLHNSQRRAEVRTLNQYGLSRRAIKVCGGKG